MAVDFTVPVRRGSQYFIDPKDIVIKPELNGRYDEPDVEELIESMVANGQYTPCLVRSDGGKPVLLEGHRRWRAAVEINRRKLVPGRFALCCTYFRGNEKDGFLAGVRVNHERQATTPLDDSFNISRMRRWGMSDEQVAEVFNEDVAWVRRTEKLISLSEDSKTAIKDKKVKPSAVSALAKMTQEEQARAVKSASKERPVTKAALAVKKDKPSLRFVVKYRSRRGVVRRLSPA